jgi:hypothetical protein
MEKSAGVPSMHEKYTNKVAAPTALGRIVEVAEVPSPEALAGALAEDKLRQQMSCTWTKATYG